MCLSERFQTVKKKKKKIVSNVAKLWQSSWTQFGFPIGYWSILCSRLHFVLSREVTQIRQLRLPIVYLTEIPPRRSPTSMVNSHCCGNGRRRRSRRSQQWRRTDSLELVLDIFQHYVYHRILTNLRREGKNSERWRPRPRRAPARPPPQTGLY